MRLANYTVYGGLIVTITTIFIIIIIEFRKKALWLYI